MSSDSQQPGWGSGSGKGGGSGGAIRDAGGAMGKRGAAKEEEYFRQLNNEQMDTLTKSIHEEIKYHKDQIEDIEEMIERHQKKLEELKKLAESAKAKPGK
jgi:transposase